VCLILFGWRAHPRYELVVAANRDEFHQRPTADAAFWQEEPTLLAGRDLQAGGTWMGVTRSGRFAAITNYREPLAPETPLERSRGGLVRDYLAGEAVPEDAASRLSGAGSHYRGFNLLMGQLAGRSAQLVYVSNRSEGCKAVAAGVHGLSNHLLDTDWPKVRDGRARLAAVLSEDVIDSETLFDLMTDRGEAGGSLPGAMESHLAPEALARHYFIVSPVYGTRSTTVLLAGTDGRLRFEERRFGPDGALIGRSDYEFDMRPD
jgi:uncharacterized protein with NRDE domain